MTRPLLIALAAAVAFAPADAAHAQAAEPVLEIVSFRLVDGSDEAAFLSAARGTEDMLRQRGSLKRRYLVKSEDGRWTDVIEWTSMEEALAAAEDVMSEPDFAPFGAMIDGATVDMRHATIRFRME